MKKGLLIAAIVALIFSMPTQSQAHRYDRDDAGHPLRFVAYVLHPVGIAAEYLVTRPFHRWISIDKDRAIIFGHDPREGEKYSEWK